MKENIFRIISEPCSLTEKLKELSEWSDGIYMAYAWASTGGGNGSHWRNLDIKKVKKAIIGIHFLQTEPLFLRKLSKKKDRLKVIEDTQGVFHPKVILGIKRGRGKIIIGSSNFTVGGFKGNTELNVYLEGPLNFQPIEDIKSFIEAQWNSIRCVVPDKKWILNYEKNYSKKPSPPRLQTRKRKTPFKVTKATFLDLSWIDYYRLISNQEKRTLRNDYEIHVFDHKDGSYLQEADNCHRAIKTAQKFKDISFENRRIIAGFGPDCSGYFGRMHVAGFYKQLINKNPKKISPILDNIPLSGKVSLEQARIYLEKIIQLKGVQVGTASRLLGMKRPDVFLPVNDGNREKLYELFKQAAETVKSYIALHEVIWRYPWVNSNKPKGGDELRVWQNRVALLDALLYEIPQERL